MTQILSPVIKRGALAVVVYRDAQHRVYFVRVKGQKYNSVLHDVEVRKAGFDSLQFGDIIACDVAGHSYFDAVKNKTIENFCCVNVRTPTDTEYESR